MGSKRLEGVTFHVYSNDHQSKHVHCFYDGSEIIVDLLADGKVALADRANCIKPSNSKVSTVRKVLAAAGKHVAELNELWESIHGK